MPRLEIDVLHNTNKIKLPSPDSLPISLPLLEFTCLRNEQSVSGMELLFSHNPNLFLIQERQMSRRLLQTFPFHISNHLSFQFQKRWWQNYQKNFQLFFTWAIWSFTTSARPFSSNADRKNSSERLFGGTNSINLTQKK